MKNSPFALSLFLLLIFTQNNPAAGGIDPTFNASVTEGFGNVSRTLTQSDGKILAFGSFQRANGARFNNIVRFNADGTLDTTFYAGGSGANGSVNVAALQTDNKIIIGGNFTAFNGTTINRIARLNADGSFDSSFNPASNFTNSVLEIVIQPDGKIIAASALVGSPPSSRIVRFNADGSLDSGFQNNLMANGSVNSIALAADSKLLVGGEFSTIGGFTKISLARLNADGSVDNAFTASLNASINKIIIQTDGKLLLAGSFPLGVYRLNADGSDPNPPAKSTAPEFIVYNGFDAALLPDGKVLVAYGIGSGVLTSFYVYRLNADLTLDGGFQPTAPEKVPTNDINLLADGKFIIGGSFVWLNNEPRLHIARLNADGSVDTGFTAAISVTASVRTIKRQPDGKIIVGGIFDYVNGVRKRHIARLNADGTLDNSFNVPLDLFYNDSPNYVFDIELQSDGKIIVARYVFTGLLPALTDPEGSFSDVGIIRLNSDGSHDESFMTIEAGLMRSVAIGADNSVYIGGSFSQLQMPPNSGTFCKLLPDGDLDTAFYPAQQPAGAISDIVIQPDNKILVSGVFSTVGGTAHPGTVRYNANGTIDASYNAVVPNIYALGLANDGKIYAGGSFASIAANPNRNFTRLNANGAVDLSFNTGSSANAAVRDLVVLSDGKIIIGGDFTDYNGSVANHIARVNANGSFDPTFYAGTGASGIIYALEKQTNGKVIAGGQFLDFDGTEKLSIVRLQNSNAATPFDFDGDAKSDLSIFRPNAGEWWYQRSSNGQVFAAGFGSGSDKIVPADFTGDGKTDIAFWRPSTGEWYVLRSEDNSFYSVPFGASGDLPAPADFDGDGKADPAVFRPAGGTWFINKSSGGTDIVNFGQTGDFPAVGDYDGDGKSDIAVFRPSSGEWWLNRSTAGIVAATFGISSDKPVQGDYTGDGKTDLAIWRPATGEWFVLRSENASYFSIPFGQTGDVPTAGDFDGDGRADTAVFRPSTATWYVNRSTAGLLIQQFGLSTDTPVPSAFLP